MKVKDLTDIQITGIDSSEHPEYESAYIYHATYNGIPLTDEELEELQNSDPQGYYEVIGDEVIHKASLLFDEIRDNDVR